MELITRTPVQERFLVKDLSFVGATRRSIRALAEQAGLSGEPLGRLDIISTELATNLAKHVSGGGEIVAFDASTGESKAIRLLSIDRGSGITNIDRVLTDGVSTAGTMGTGLGAIKRLSDTFELSSVPGKGTAILCTVSLVRETCEKTACGVIDLAAISLPRIGEKNCGDGFSAACSSELTSILVVDGLGHGDGAAEAAEKATRVFAKKPFESLESIVEEAHRELAGTRGAAIALVQIDHDSNKVEYIGVGNITCRIYSRYSSKGCVSAQGIVGERIGSLKQYTYEWSPESSLLMYSDGIKSAAGLCQSQSNSAMLAAAEIYRDFYRTTDDTTVVVARDRRRKSL